MSTVLYTTSSNFRSPIGWNPHSGTITTKTQTIVTLDTTNTTVTKQKYMRSVYVKFKGDGFKPFSTQTPFFDNIDVSKWCCPFTKEEYDDFSEVVADETGYFAKSTLWKNGAGKPIQVGRDGSFYGVFKIPPSTFVCGTTTLKFVSSDGDVSETTYTSSGTLKTSYNEITTSVKVALSDPIAQSFYIDVPDDVQGCYLTSIGLYFKTKSSSENLYLELRKLENGYPSSERMCVVAVKPSDVVISNNGDSRYETKVTFPEPIYVENKAGYAFVLRSNSTEYNVWCATVGEGRFDKDEIVDRNPYSGMLFRSANNDTWNADQTTDMKFRVYRAKFKQNKTDKNEENKVFAKIRTAILPPPSRTAYRTYIETYKMYRRCRIFATNHGLFVGSKVRLDCTLKADDSDDPKIGDINMSGTGAKQFIGTWPVVAVDSISFTVEVGGVFNNLEGLSAAEQSLHRGEKEYFWINSLTWTPNINTDLVYFNQVKTEFQGTRINHKFYPFYVTPKGNPTTGISEFYEIEPNTELKLDEKVCFPSVEEIKRMGIDNRYPAFITTTLESDNNYVSPMINLEGTSMVTADYIFNNPARDDIQSGNLVLDTDETEKNQMIDHMSILESSIETPNTLFRYVTQPVELESESTSLKVIFAGNVTKDNYVQVFYRILSSGENCDIEEKDWINIPYSGSFSYATEEDEYYDYEYEISGLDPFRKIQVKVVGWGDDKSIPVKIKDFRAVALAK